MNLGMSVSLCLLINGLTLAEGQPNGAKEFNSAMSSIVKSYLNIQEALARDSLEGVAKAAKQIMRDIPSIDSSKLDGQNVQYYLSLPKSLSNPAKLLSEVKDLSTARSIFMELSRPLTKWASTAKPNGVVLAFCSMADGGQGAGWLQKKGPLRNPYYGSAMLECGEFIRYNTMATLY